MRKFDNISEKFLDDNYKKIKIFREILSYKELFKLNIPKEKKYIYDKYSNLISVGDNCEFILKGKRKKYTGRLLQQNNTKNSFAFEIEEKNGKFSYIDLSEINVTKLVSLEEMKSIYDIMNDNQNVNKGSIYNIIINNPFEAQWFIWYLDKHKFDGFGRDLYTNDIDESFGKGKYKSFAHILNIKYPCEFKLYYIHSSKYIGYKFDIDDNRVKRKNIWNIKEFIEHYNKFKKDEKYRRVFYKELESFIDLSEKNIFNSIEPDITTQEEINRQLKLRIRKIEDRDRELERIQDEIIEEGLCTKKFMELRYEENIILNTII